MIIYLVLNVYINVKNAMVKTIYVNNLHQYIYVHILLEIIKILNVSV